MFGPTEVQMIGRYFGNNAVYSAAAAARAACHLTSELEVATRARQVKPHSYYNGHPVEALHLHTFKSKPHKKKPAHAELSDDELMQVLFTKMDKVPFHGADRPQVKE